jgi:hypothetical protein
MGHIVDLSLKVLGLPGSEGISSLFIIRRRDIGIEARGLDRIEFPVFKAPQSD